MTTSPSLLVMQSAFPCADIALQLGNMTEKDYAMLEKALLARRPLPRATLERCFPALTRRLKEVAKKERLAYWSVENIRTHSFKHHDAYIDDGDGLLKEMMPCEKELCRCKLYEVVAVEERPERIYTVKTENGDERVLGRYLPGATPGAIIAVHRRFATDALSPAQATQYGFRRSRSRRRGGARSPRLASR